MLNYAHVCMCEYARTFIFMECEVHFLYQPHRNICDPKELQLWRNEGKHIQVRSDGGNNVGDEM